MKTLRFLATSIFIALGIVPTASAEGDLFTPTGKELYESVFGMSGLLLRAGYICTQNDSRIFINTAFDVQTATPELSAIGKAYPSATQEWMTLGATMMNERVMRDGLKSACLQVGELVKDTITAIAAQKERQKKKR